MTKVLMNIRIQTVYISYNRLSSLILIYHIIIILSSYYHPYLSYYHHIIIIFQTQIYWSHRIHCLTYLRPRYNIGLQRYRDYKIRVGGKDSISLKKRFFEFSMIINFKKEKHGWLLHSWLDKGLQGIVVNYTWHSIN